MANTIVLKRSSVAGKVPLSTDLQVGELAVNLADQKLYSKNGSGTVIELGGSGDVVGPSSSSDYYVALFNGTTGKLLRQGSVWSDSSGNLTIAGSLTTTGGNTTIGATTATSTHNLAGGATASGNTKTVYLGAYGAAGSTTNITIGSANSTTSTTFNGSVTFPGSVTLNGAVTINGGVTSDTDVWNIGSGQIYKAADGKVGIGTTTPAEALDVNGTIRSGVDVSAYVKVGRFNATFGGAAIDTAGSATFLSLQTEGVEGLRIAAVTGALASQPTYNNTATGSTVVVTSTGAIRRTSSSIKYKKDVEDLDRTLVTNAVDRLRPVYYRTKNPEGDDKAAWSHIGLIAEEVHEVEPRLVRYRTAEVETDEDGNRVERELEVPEPEDVDYARLSVLLLAEVKDLRARMAKLEGLGQ